jgi:ATP-dependent helicase/DNAse subunit B
MEFMKANEYAILQLQSDDTASAIKINVTRFQHSSEALLQESGNMSDESSISVMAV